MALMLDWQTQVEGESAVIDLVTEFAVLQLTLSGQVVLESNWLIRHAEPETRASVFINKLKLYLENPDAEPLSLNLLERGSEFSRRVWLELIKIPYGETMTYAELAKRLNSGSRAVANACRNNPFPGIIPCHRVLSVNGIGGFMGQSQGEYVELKRRILQYEAAKRLSTRCV